MESNEIRRAAVVTGGGRGIGRAICVKLASEGYDVLINYAGNAASATETAELCRKANDGVRVFILQADISKEEEANRLIETAIQEFGRVDVLVNNAGITRDNILIRMDAGEFDQVLGTNLRGTFLCCKAVTRQMMRQKYGRIVNLASIVGIYGNAGQANYSASKAGVIGLTKSIAKELASRNITANAVAPGYIATDMTAEIPEKEREAILAGIPAKRIGTPEDVADAVAFLASERASYVNGQVLGVDGGM